MTRARRIVFNIAAQTHYEIVDGARVRVFMQSPNFSEHGFARDVFALMANQIAKDIGFHKSQWKNLIADAQLQAIEIHRLAVEAEGVARSAHPLIAAQQAIDSRDQNSELEWLGQIIVGAGGETFQYVLRMAARGQHQSG